MVKENLVKILYPTRCILCDQVLHFKSSETRCTPCKEKVKWITGELCKKCGKPLDEYRLELCYDCSKSERFYTMGRGMYLYKGEIKHSIHRYKYGSRKGYGKSFAKELIYFYLSNCNWEIDLITSVPLHSKKMKARGFNQSALLADILGEGLKLRVDNRLLIKTKDTKAQKDLPDIERILNLKDVFSINKECICYNKNILIVDDIYTTGSTINNCAKALRQNGVGNIYFLTIAIGKGN